MSITLTRDENLDEAADARARAAAFAPPQRYARRLPDKILIAFHSACDQADVEVAQGLIRILETIAARRPAGDNLYARRTIEGLVAGHERLWHLRNPGLENAGNARRQPEREFWLALSDDAMAAD